MGMRGSIAYVGGIVLKNYKNTGFLSNTGPDPLKMTQLQSQHSMWGHQRHARFQLNPIYSSGEDLKLVSY